jgi:hypothetical protein
MYAEFLTKSRKGEAEHQCRNSVIDTTVKKLDSRNKKNKGKNKSCWALSLETGDTIVTEHAPEPENKKSKRSMQYRKWDFPLPVMIPLLEMGGPLPVLVNCAFWDLHLHS